MKKVIVPENVHRPFGYAHAIQIDKTLYVSGQIPLDQEMNVVVKGTWRPRPSRPMKTSRGSWRLPARP